jgi:DNA-binding response OmpR family regulator
MIQNNWKYKLLALSVSLILWFHVNSERNPQSSRTFDVSVKPVGVTASHIAEVDTPKVSITVAGLTIDPLRRQARAGDRDVELTVLEFELLYLLASNRGIVFSREALVSRVWGGDTYVTERSVDTIIKRLRRKIEPDPAEPRFILTVWGTGYKFADV